LLTDASPPPPRPPSYLKRLTSNGPYGAVDRLRPVGIMVSMRRIAGASHRSLL
jgi:hypothetical protein